MRRRRFLLVLAGTLVGAPALASCDLGEPGPTPPTALPATDTAAPSPTRGADDELRDLAGQSEMDLIAAHTAAISAHPSMAADLEPLLAAHREHLQALTGSGVPEVGTPLPLDKSVRATRRWLAGLERAAADQRAGAAGAASEAGLASLLTLVAASEAQHHEVLSNPEPS